LNAEQIDPGFIMTEVISQSAYQLVLAGFAGNTSQCIIDATMQYVQQDQGGGVNIKNTFGWKGRGWGYRSFYLSLANSNYLGKRAKDSRDSTFLRGVSLTMQAYWFGFNTSGWGDVPFSEAMRGEDNILRPKYDSQKEVFKGILNYLDKANETFSNVSSVSDFTKSSDIMFNGDIAKWQAFTNSLRLRFLMRLSEKTNEMNEIGVDVKAEFNKIFSDRNKYPIILSNENNAVVQLPGLASNDSWPLGPFNQKTEDPYRRQKPGAPFVNFLKEKNDPRLTVWIKPVDVQTVIDDKGDEKVILIDENGKVKKYLRSLSEYVDTSLFVGLPIALANPDNYNGNSSDDRNAIGNLNPNIYSGGASNPYVSYFASMFRENTSPYLPGTFITASEVYLILAEAVVRGWISGSAEEFFKNGILTSLRQYDIFDGDLKVYNPVNHKIQAYNEDEFINSMINHYNSASDKLLPIMEQKWLSLFTTLEAWFDWRRTGYPNLGKNLVSGPHGEKMPIRFYFGDSEKNFNEENVNKAIERLEPPIDDQWSKIWLLQGTGKPYN
ncbi:MAG: SusD/RagB family nutrient-binding outer membrane lipoprotein, partial [Bacteroidales bacterium]|nr:SusD/RagB family nutrient-binding outer membrane lipoprotein [Bacteroidales bacterium]